jgi:glycine hydroxymethyltransferase
LADALINEGFELVSGGTDNHLINVKLVKEGVTGKELEHRLDEVHITANKNTIPNDPQSPFVTSGLRIGTPAVTTRGFKEAEMVKIAHWLRLIVDDFEANKEQVTKEVMELCAKFPIY